MSVERSVAPSPVLAQDALEWTRARPAWFAAVWARGSVACIWLLIATAALNGLSIQFHGASVYPEYIALGMAGAWVAAGTVLGLMEWSAPRPLLPLLGWLGAALLATVLYAPDRHQSLVLWLKLLLMVAVYLIVANLARGRLASAIAGQLAAGAIIGVLAVLAYSWWKLTGSHLGMQHPGGNMGKGWLPGVTLREPNILGSYLVAATVLGLPLALALYRWRVATWGAVVLGAVGIVASGTRTAWLALLLCLLVAGARVAFQRRVGLRWVVPPVVLAGMLALGLAVTHTDPRSALPAFNPRQGGDLAQRVASFGDLSRDRDIVTRVQIAGNALTHWQTHPLTGWGVGAYGEVYRYPPPDTIHPGWISNLPVHLLYDSGLLGLAAFAWAMVLAAIGGVRAWLGAAGVMRAAIAGLLLALLGLLLAFQATEATWFAYPWIYLGLLQAAVWSAAARQTPSRLEIR
jgi:hypothetical protein